MAGQQSVQHFYEITLTSMATDMVKGIPVVGYKIFLQLLAHLNPEMTASNIPKLITIKSSYENRKNVGLSLLWAWSQAGRKNLAVGLKIWHELMSPMLDMKGYANYVVQILNDLVFGHDNVRDLSVDLYLDIITETYSNKFNNQPANLAVEISASIDKLRVSSNGKRETVEYALTVASRARLSRSREPHLRRVQARLVSVRQLKLRIFYSR